MNNKCETLQDIFDNHFKETDITDVICENYSNFNGKITKENFDKSQKIKTPIVLRIYLKITIYDKEKLE